MKVSMTLVLVLGAVAASPGVLADEVVVYVPKGYEELPVPIFRRDDTNVASERYPGKGDAIDEIVAITYSGSGEEATTRIIEKTASPVADVLVTRGVAQIWRAAEEGALRPALDGEYDTVPRSMKDADNLWAAFAYRPILIGIASTEDAEAIVGYRDLASPAVSGKLCLTSFAAYSENQTLIAMLIAEHGVKPAERIVRLWMRNLAKPPFDTKKALVDAMESGVCHYAIGVNGSTSVWRFRHPDPIYFDVDAVGVARHANDPDAAWRYVARRLGKPSRPSDVSRLPGFTKLHITLAGFHAEEARLLAERVGYR